MRGSNNRAALNVQTSTMCKLHLGIGPSLLLGLAGTGPSAWSQEVKDAPTVEQCRADQKLWMAKLERTAPADGLANFSFGELVGWKGEMMECRDGDPEFQNQYVSTMSEISSN